MSYSNWAGTDIKLHYNEEGQYHFYNGILLTAEDGFKFRVGDDWAIQVGSGATAVLPADGSILNTMELVGDVEQIKEGENFIVVETGYYSVFIKTVEEKTCCHNRKKWNLSPAGTATAGGWDADSGALAFVSVQPLLTQQLPLP